MHERTETNQKKAQATGKAVQERHSSGGYPIDLPEGGLPTRKFSIDDAESLPVLATSARPRRFAISLRHLVRKLQIAIRELTRNSLEHFGVRRELFHKHQEALDRFLGFVTGEAAANEI